MIQIREVTTVRIELDFKVLIGELPQMEKDWMKMPIDQFIKVWEPEMQDKRGMLYLLKEKKDESGSKREVAKGSKVRRV